MHGVNISENDRRKMLEVLIDGLEEELERAIKHQNRASRRLKRAEHTNVSKEKLFKLRQDVASAEGEIYSCAKRLRGAEMALTELF